MSGVESSTASLDDILDPSKVVFVSPSSQQACLSLDVEAESNSVVSDSFCSLSGDSL